MDEDHDQFTGSADNYSNRVSRSRHVHPAGPLLITLIDGLRGCVRRSGSYYCMQHIHVTLLLVMLTSSLFLPLNLHYVADRSPQEEFIILVEGEPAAR